MPDGAFNSIDFKLDRLLDYFTKGAAVGSISSHTDRLDCKFN